MAVSLGSKAEGSIVKIKENGVLVDFYISKQNYESGLNGYGRVLVVRKDCYDLRQWNISTPTASSESTVSAYATSAIDAWLNGTYKNLLDTSIRTAMGTTKIYYTPSLKNQNVSTLDRSVFVLSATELGQSKSGMKVEGTALSGPVLNLLKIAYLNGSSEIQWTRSMRTGLDGMAWCLFKNGDSAAYYCTDTHGARPAFTLPSSLYVDDNSTVFVNTAPGIPSSISVPSNIQGGSTITVTWGASTDRESNLDGYILERSIDGGSSWTQIYQGGARSTSNNVAFGTVSVMYRVKAYDTEGVISGWKTSEQVMVINNTAPTAPNSINIPERIRGGQPLVITWGEAYDGENNLSGYSLERQVNGGAWAVIYSGNTLSYTDTITKGWASVKYRVRAYDTNNAYSSYTESVSLPVDNNTAPDIACLSSSGSDLGIRDSGFTVTYTVSDVDGDEVTVTEAIDGVTKRTFMATLDGNNSFNVTGEYFMKLLNGDHTLTITASDGKASTVHTLTFSKEVTAATITLEEAMTADAEITICVLSVSSSIPSGAIYKVEVTNNANDESPVWEDCTAELKNGANHIFGNRTAANGFAFNFRVTAERGTSGESGYITSVQGGFQ